MSGHINKGMFTSDSSEWETPTDLFDYLNEIYHFTTDVCATKENAKCKNFFSKEDNGLAFEWRGRCWCNPPYGREISKWIEKAYNESLKPGTVVVMLLPSRTDTAYFHDYLLPYADIQYIRGRLKFSGSANSAPFPSLIAVFGHEWMKKD